MPFNHGSRRTTLLIILLCTLLAIVSSSPIDPVSSLAAASAITTTTSADPTPTPTTASSIPSSTSNEPESAPSTTCTKMPTPTCTPTPSCTPTAAAASFSSSSLTSNLPLPLPALIGIGAGILVLILVAFVALYCWRRWRSFSLRPPAVSDDELLQTWATHGTGRLMLANHYGVTNPYFSGNPRDIRPGEFVVRQTGSRAEMLDVWARVNGVVKPGSGAADGAGHGLLAGRMRQEWEDRGWVALEMWSG